MELIVYEENLDVDMNLYNLYNNIRVESMFQYTKSFLFKRVGS